MTRSDSEAYLAKKQFLARLLTVYGRKPVLEALQSRELVPHKLHLADSNQPAAIIEQMCELARSRKVPIATHSRQALSRISKNGKQDQGVALDVHCERFASLAELLQQPCEQNQLLALDNVTNPQNLGMIVRSVCASPMDGLLLPHKGCAKLDSLVIKASAGTLFKARIYRAETLADSLQQLRDQGYGIYGLHGNGTISLRECQPKQRAVFVLGNESEGLSAAVKASCTELVKIPMHNGVESLNVSVAAGLVAFRGQA